MPGPMMIVTVLSLVIAAAMTVFALRVLRRERQRSEARVAALALMAEEGADVPLRPGFVRRTSFAPADLPIREAPHASAVEDSHEMFAAPPQASPWPQRALAAAAVVAVVLVFAGIVGAMSRGAGPAPPDAARAASAPSPLELLSLRNEQSAGALVVTGSIRNPRDAGADTGIVATVFAFAKDGTFLNSARAPLQKPVLQPGDESRFAVTVPFSGAAARYRVSFRAEDGRVLAHVDRRQPEPIVER